jgi:hypothetical protein
VIAAFALAAIVYADVPPEVERVAVYRWNPGRPPIAIDASIVRDGSRLTIVLPASPAAFVELRRAGEDYVLDGPVAISPAERIERRLDGVWRHTAGGNLDAAVETIDWLTSDDRRSDFWPACWTADRRWACEGVPLGAAGVVLAAGGGRLWSAVALASAPVTLHPSTWGRLVVVRDAIDGAPTRLKVTAARPVDPPPQRSRAVRLETARLDDVRATAVGASAMWVAGDSSPPSAWLEVRSARAGPAYLALHEVSGGSPQVPMHVLLDETRAVEMTVVSDRGDSAAAALITVFRVIEPRPADATAPDRPPPRRVFTAEAIADGDGRVTIDGIGEAAYEIVAWHSTLGRGSVPLSAGAHRVTIRLQSPGTARGRVLAGGKPAAGVDVIAVPDPSAYMTAEDPTELKGGDARTGLDGRFAVSLATGGGGELRVGGGTHAIRRVPLPRAPLPLIELGDIELGRSLVLSVALDRDPGCDLRATGPIGRAGLRIVTATRTGPGLFTLTLPEEGSWEFGLLCGGDERALAPPVVRVSDHTRSVTFAVRF